MNEGMLGFPRGNGFSANQPAFDSLILVKFAGVTEVILDNCFTPPYAHYRLMVDFLSWSSTTNIIYQFRLNNGTYASADYDTQIMTASAGTQSTSASVAQTSARIGQMFLNPGVGTVSVDFMNPQRNARTITFSQCSAMNGTTAAVWESDTTQTKVTTPMSGLRLSSSSGTSVFSGTARLYGYRLP